MRGRGQIDRPANDTRARRLPSKRLVSNHQDMPSQPQDAVVIGRSKVSAVFILLIPALAVVGLALVGAHSLALVLVLVLISAGR